MADGGRSVSRRRRGRGRATPGPAGRGARRRCPVVSSVPLEVQVVGAALAGDAVVAVELVLLLRGEVAGVAQAGGVLDHLLVVGDAQAVLGQLRLRQGDEGLGGAEEARVDGHPLRLAGRVVDVDLAGRADLVAVAVDDGGTGDAGEVARADHGELPFCSSRAVGPRGTSTDEVLGAHRPARQTFAGQVPAPRRPGAWTAPRAGTRDARHAAPGVDSRRPHGILGRRRDQTDVTEPTRRGPARAGRRTSRPAGRRHGGRRQQASTTARGTDVVTTPRRGARCP